MSFGTVDPLSIRSSVTTIVNVNTTKATMRIKRKPGEMMEVDWAGKTLAIYDRITGEPTTAYVL